MKYLMFIVQNTKDLDNIAVDVDISTLYLCQNSQFLELNFSVDC